MGEVLQGLVVRPVWDDELDHVRVSWRESFFDHHVDRVCSKDKLREAWGLGVIPRLIEKSEILVATHRDEPRVILGWIAFQRLEYRGKQTAVLHYCHVKRAFQQLGIATALINTVLSLPHESVEYSHETRFLHHIHRTDWSPAKWRVYL